MHPTQWAVSRAEHPAIIMAPSGEQMDYAALDAFSNRGAQLFRALGFATGDVVAIWSDNRIDYLPVCWAAERAGLAFVPVSSRLKAAEALYILRDAGARALILSAGIGAEALDLVREVVAADPAFPLFTLGGFLPGCQSWDAAVEAMPAIPIGGEAPGRPMLYSSGTTGRAKGIVHSRRAGTILDEHPYELWFRDFYSFGDDSVFLSPAPLYHAAPLLFSLTVHRMGGTVVVMERFDAEQCLALIARHRVTHAQLVPTMFVRLLRLPLEVRNAYDLSSLRAIVHAGSPCPVDVKQGMIEWLGPIIHEYYGASEGFGRTCIGPDEWLERPGSVGRATQGVLRLCDEEGREVGAGETGHVDAEGYLYLTDRHAFTIISGSVNIYPQEAEDILSGHPLVADAAVFGVPRPRNGRSGGRSGGAGCECA
ncbi:MAG: AMP-binding protein [Sphingobium sp.]